VPGVLNQELVLEEEISRYTPVWNDSPVTVYHPPDGESHVSARSLEMLDQYATGRLYNVRFEEGRLKGEVWIDLQRLAVFGDTGDTILRQIVEETGCEVSTGYFRDVEHESGVFNNQRYVSVARNIRPDHLALLPAAEGACNWADGCGVPRINKKESPMTDSSAGVPFVNKNLVRRALAALAEALGVEVRSTARTPEYDGVEDTSWGDVDKSLSAYIAGYNKNGGGSEEGSTIADISAACKSWIASKSLLGEASAETADDLIFFPVVNPSSNKLNLGALRAVLSGRGAQADISSSTLDSARAKAQSLLDENTETSEAAAVNSEETEAVVSLLVSLEGASALALTPGDLPSGSIVIEAAGLSAPLLTYESEEEPAEVLRYLSSELAGVARATSIMMAPITGFGRTVTEGEYDVFYLSIGGQSIQRWAYDLAEYLGYWAYSPEGEESEPPCVEVTPLQLILAYLPKGAPTPTVNLESLNLVFSHISVTCGSEQIVFALAGEMRPAPAAPPEEEPTETAAARPLSYAELMEMLTLAKNSRGVTPAADPEPEAAEPSTNGETNMPDRRQLIEALLANADCQCTRDALEAMSTDDLQVMADELLTPDEQNPGEIIPMPSDEEPTPVSGNEDQPPAIESEPEATPVDDASPEPVNDNAGEPEPDPEPVPAAAPELPAELTELLAAVREFGGVSSVVAALRTIQANVADERSDLIASLTSNARCAFTAEQLANFTTEQLTLLQQSMEPADFSFKPRPNGRTAPGSVVVEIPMPTL